MGSKIMTKKKVLITLGVALALIIIGLGTFAVIQNKKIISSISCNGEDAACAYVLKTGLGVVINGSNFTKDDIIQCSVENSKNPEVYELHLHLKTMNNAIVLKSKNKEKISAVCSNIRENKPFIYEFRHKIRKHK